MKRENTIKQQANQDGMRGNQAPAPQPESLEPAALPEEAGAPQAEAATLVAMDESGLQRELAALREKLTMARDEQEKLQQQLDEARDQVQELTGGWQRARADYENLSKRTEQQLFTSRFESRVDTLEKILPVLDDFELALEKLPPEVDADNPWLAGIRAIQRKLLKSLTDAGVRVIDPTGQLFDPTLHEALGRDENSACESGTVTITYQKGYLCGDRLLRPARVLVAD